MDEREFLKREHNASDEEIDMALADAEKSINLIQNELENIKTAVCIIEQAVESAKEKLPRVYVGALMRSTIRIIVSTITGCKNVEIELED